MDALEWAETVSPRWRTCLPSTDYGMPEPILGPEDGGAEWSHGETPVHVFTFIDTYEQLKSGHGLYLFGRRGTGKTSLLRMLDYEVKSGREHRYKVCWVCDSHPLLVGVAAQLRQTRILDLTTAELALALEPIWAWFAFTSAMIAVLEQSPDNIAEPFELKQLRAHIHAVVGQDVTTWPRTNVREVLENKLARALRNLPDAPSAGEVRNAITQAFDSPEHRRAIALVVPMLKTRPCLVVLDAGEVYAVRDPIPAATITSLIATVHSFATDRAGNGLFLKAAFPSEILSHVYPLNAGKMKGRIALIHWTYRDLVVFLAKRFRMALLGDGSSKEFDRLQSFSEARQYLYTLLPARVTTRNGITFDTISYVVRHTQKTPRQVILLMNSILTEAKRKTGRIGSIVSEPDLIVRGIHGRLDHLVADAIDMHKDIHPDVEMLVKRLLSQQESYFSGRRLDALVKRVSDYRDLHHLSRDAVKRILFQVGALGIAHEAHALPQEGKWLLETMFEYQIKDTLAPSEEALCAVHPMFYGWLQSRVDPCTLTYPYANEDDEREILSAYGLQLAGA